MRNKYAALVHDVRQYEVSSPHFSLHLLHLQVSKRYELHHPAAQHHHLAQDEDCIVLLEYQPRLHEDREQQHREEVDEKYGYLVPHNLLQDE